MPAHDHTTSIEYRDILGCPGYRVGNDGSVWSQRIPRWGLRASNPWRQMKPELAEGYPRVSLYSGTGKATRQLVHRLVLEAFVGPCPEGMECRHLDGTRTNNWLENLAWGTYSENEQDKVRHGRTVRGERHGLAKLTDADILEICDLRRSGQTLEAISVRFGISHGVASKILLGKMWQHVAREHFKTNIHCGTVNHGESHGMSKLTSDQVIEIRRLRSSGLTLKRIAVAYGVTETLVSNIARGKIWRHLLPESADNETGNIST